MRGSETSEEQVRQEICRVGKLLFERGFVAGTEGNISVRLSEREVLVTPTRVSKGMMTPEMLVKVDLFGRLVEGRRSPTSELKMHLRIYRERPDVRAVVHAHPPYATAHAVAGIPLDRAFLPESVIYVGEVPIAPYALPSTEEVAEAIAPYLRDHHALLLENHGAVAWADDLWSAYFLLENVEQMAKIHFLARTLGRIRGLSHARVQELESIKEAMGSFVRSPRGFPCPSGVDICAEDFERGSKPRSEKGR
ncbi:MAG: class II aldolase/adducin family protein [Hydrogenibacillus schlegelii]|nr:class II aldolase/adducin family protein [Hydrogenibacillus schlegelii]